MKLGKNLVTGGLGFVGRYVAKQLVAEGEEVILFQRSTNLSAVTRDLEGKVKIFGGDIGNWVHVVDAVKSNNIDCIYHVAALLTRDCDTSPATCFQVNVVGTFNVLEAARILGVPHVIYCSTGYAHNLTRSSLTVAPVITDETAQRPANMYSTSKYMSEHLGEQYYRQYGVDFRGVRLGMIIGPNRQMTYYFGDYSGVIDMPARGKPYTIHVHPSIPQGIIYVKDAAGVMISLRKADQNKLRQRMYNASGFMAAVTEMADSVKRYLPKAQIYFDWDESEEMKFASLDSSFAMDNTSLMEDTGWRPRYLLDEAVSDFVREIQTEQESLE